MPYGTIKVDTITFTNAGVDKSVAISGLVQNPTFTGNVTATGTISGLIVQAPTVTGTTANFASGVYTTQISGAIVKVPAGGAGAPSIQVGVGASVAPGLYGAGTDLLGISTGGAGRIFIDSTGQLGVGTSTPQNKLEVIGDGERMVCRNATNSGIARIEAQVQDYASGSSFIGTSIVQNGSTTAGTNAGLSNANLGILNFQNTSAGLVVTNGATPLVFATTSTERMRIDSSGRVGVGTSSPVSGLDLAGAVPVFTLKSSTNTGSGTPIISSIESYSSVYGLTNAKISFLQGTSGYSDLGCIALYSKGFDGLNERLRIDSSGRVGIGTSSPGAIFEVDTGNNSTIALFNSTAANGGGISLRASGTTRATLGLGANFITGASLNDVSLTSAGAVLFGNTSGTERLRIDSSGRVGIGTTNPQDSVVNIASSSAAGAFNPLLTHLSGGYAGSHSLYLGAWTSTGTDRLHGCKIKTNYNYASTSATALSFEVTNAGGSLFEAARIDSSGRVGIGTNSPNSLLDVNGAVTARGDGSLVGIYLGSDCAIRNTGTGSATYIDLATGSASHGYLIVRSSNAYNERLRIDDAGNVGIGTSSPGSLLDVRFPTSPTTDNGPGSNTLRVWTSSALAADTGGAISLGGVSTTGGAASSFGQIAGRKVNATSADYAGYLQFSVNNAVGTMLEAMRINNAGRVGIGTSSPTTLLDVNSDTVRLRTARTPASATATGTAGEICWDANYIYVCTATDTWRRTALSSW